MSPIIESFAGVSARGYGLFSLAATNSYESIATVTVGAGGSSSISFTSIPSTYKHLQIRGIAKSTVSGTDSSYMLVSANSDTTTTNYMSHYLQGTGSGVGAGSNNSYGGALYTGVASKTGQTNIGGASIIDILDYASTNKNKTFRTLTGADYNGSGEVWFASAVWLDTSAITSLTLSLAYAGNFDQYSSFALYGIKG